MADIAEVKEGDRVRIVFEGTVRTKVNYNGHPRVDIQFVSEADEYDLGAGVYWYKGEFSPEIVVLEQEQEIES